MLTEEQLQAWSLQANPAYAYEACETINRVLKAGYPLREKKFEVYLQGCYINDTNISSYEDADIVVQLNETFDADISSLNTAEQILYNENIFDSNYSYDDFWYDILRAFNRLTSGSTVTYGYKSIKYYNPQIGLNANIRVALQHRKYINFLGVERQKYLEGIKFLAHHEGNWVSSYPKLHYVHGEVKNLAGQTDGWFIPAIRMFKNARNSLVDRGKIRVSLAPSYFVECLLYNVPDAVFGVNHQATFKGVLEWLGKADFSGFRVQSGMEPLFGVGSSQWRLDRARAFVDGLFVFL